MAKGQTWIRKDPDNVLIIEDLKTDDGNLLELSFNIKTDLVTDRRYTPETANVVLLKSFPFPEFVARVQSGEYGEIGQDLVDEIQLYRAH